ncbi:hypothetical protein [Brevundimonas sp. M20]|uniref:hypothetical protein n=1 Tax=Brevundimonas sp. M20 TaxID=2591463 RepID=UPI001146B573|nr:hypothetical protein [Brevundimonas sp. M20]QDH74305.1 hypothetical protein FKQ52_13290 [Brevundimonas sp. M20]
MAEPGDPQHPDDHDDHVGFSSAASLQGRAREVAPEPEPEPEPTPDPEPAPVTAIKPEREPDLFDPAPPRPVIETPEPVIPPPAPEAAPKPKSRPASADSIFEPSPGFTGRSKDREEVRDPPGGGTGLYSVYALILLAVPTVGVSAMIALLAVTGRPGPEDDLSRSHFIFQQRTLWAAAIAVMAGVILLAAPFGLGVPLLFLAALWVVLRGAVGVWTLKAGKPVARPRGWWI